MIKIEKDPKGIRPASQLNVTTDKKDIKTRPLKFSGDWPGLYVSNSDILYISSLLHKVLEKTTDPDMAGMLQRIHTTFSVVKPNHHSNMVLSIEPYIGAYVKVRDEWKKVMRVDYPTRKIGSHLDVQLEDLSWTEKLDISGISDVNPKPSDSSYKVTCTIDYPQYKLEMRQCTCGYRMTTDDASSSDLDDLFVVNCPRASCQKQISTLILKKDLRTDKVLNIGI
jgi:hypothetical protein